MFLKNNMTFGQLKREIYIFARKYILNPFNNKSKKSKNNVDKELEEFINDKENNDDENILWTLIKKEYDNIFINRKNTDEKIKNFYSDFPYLITITNHLTVNILFYLMGIIH